MKVVIMGSQARSMANFWPVLIRMLVERGHAVFCFVPATDEDADQKAVDALRAMGGEVCQIPLARRGLNPFQDLRSFWFLKQKLLQIKPDVFFGYAIKPVVYGCSAAWLAEVPVRLAMITGLGYTFEADSLPKKILTKLAVILYTFALNRCKTVFFQNSEDLAVFKKHGIIPADTSDDFVQMVRGTGVDIERFAPVPSVVDPPVFLLVGRLLEAKGVREFVAAARILKQKYPEARFQILGPGEKGPGSISESEMSSWQKDGVIEYLGSVQDVRPYIAEASVMVLPSYREGLPCSIMEGMAMLRPAVVTDVPGCREVVTNGKNGFVVPVKNPEALAEGMEKFIKMPELVESLGKTGRQMAEDEFDARQVGAKIIEIMCR